VEQDRGCVETSAAEVLRMRACEQNLEQERNIIVSNLSNRKEFQKKETAKRFINIMGVKGGMELKHHISIC
jgi:hypothetical protein